MNSFKSLIVLVLGVLYLIFYRITKSHGLRKFYENAQKKNGLERSFLEDWSLIFLFKNYFYFKKYKDKKGVSSIVKDYAEREYAFTNKGELTEQQRGLGLNLLEKEITKSDINTILEIGTSNGDIIGNLGKKYKDKIFYGIDFFVDTAQKKNKLDNTNFIKGYAFDYLINSKISFDLIYSSQVFCTTPPKELENYLSIFHKKGIKKIILNETSWSNVKPVKNKNKFSIHLERWFWFHNYYAYLINAGYDVDVHKFFHYNNSDFSRRKDISISLISANIRR